MKHKTIKAATTATDRGEFSALAATYSVDRVNDRIVPGAFEKTINAWQNSGKGIPVHWDHEGSAANVIGVVNPAKMQETKDGLYVEGKIDIEESEVAKEAWRSMKNNAVSLSFGYLATRERKAKDGVNELLEIDLFEVSIVAAPANADTRLLSLKSANTLRRQSAEAAREAAMGWSSESEDGEAPVLSETEVEQAKALLFWFKNHPDVEDVIPLLEKAAWTKAYIDALPDSHFLHVEDGEMDDEGKTTPRSKRHFPCKDVDGNADLPHVRAALSSIPQSKLSRKTKSRLTADAQTIIDETVKMLNPPEELTEADPLRSRTFDVALGIANDGMKVAKRVEPEPEEEPEPIDAVELRRRSFELALETALN